VEKVKTWPWCAAITRGRTDVEEHKQHNLDPQWQVCIKFHCRHHTSPGLALPPSCSPAVFEVIIVVAQPVGAVDRTSGYQAAESGFAHLAIGPSGSFVPLVLKGWTPLRPI
jgi:hypothetical protein